MVTILAAAPDLKAHSKAGLDCWLACYVLVLSGVQVSVEAKGGDICMSVHL